MKRQLIVFLVALGLLSCKSVEKDTQEQKQDVSKYDENLEEDQKDGFNENETFVEEEIEESPGIIKNVSAKELKERAENRYTYRLSILKNPDNSAESSRYLYSANEFHFEQIEDIRNQLEGLDEKDKEELDYIYELTVGDKILLTPKHLINAFKTGYTVHVDRSEENGKKYFRYSELPGYVPEGTDVSFLTPYLNGRTPNFTTADGMNYTRFLIDDLVKEFHTTNYDPMEPIEPDDPGTISLNATNILERIQQEATEKLATHKKEDPGSYMRFGEFDLVDYMRDNGFSLRIADYFPSEDMYTFVSNRNPKLMIRFDIDYAAEGEQVKQLTYMAIAEHRLLPYDYGTYQRINLKNASIGINGIEVYYVKNKSTFPNSGTGRTDARPEDFYHVMYKMSLCDENHRMGEDYTKDGNVFMLSPELSSTYAEAQINRLTRSDITYNPENDIYHITYFVREDMIDRIKTVVDRTNALVGHESKMNKDNLFKDVDPELIVERN